MLGISVICPTYRNPKYLDICIKSLVENKTYTSTHTDVVNGEVAETEIIIVIDGYYEENKEILNKYTGSGISVIDLGVNQGMQHAINIGVMQANNPYVFVINDDNVAGKNFDYHLGFSIQQIIKSQENQLNKDKFILTVNQMEPISGMFNFKICDLGQNAESFRYEEWLLKEEELSDKNGQIPNVGNIFPFVIAKKYYLAVGGLDTYYKSPNICDWDFFLKLEILNFNIWTTNTLHLYHFGSVATKKNSEAEIFKLREQQAATQYQYKWGRFPYNAPGTNSKIPPNGEFRGFDLLEDFKL